MDTHEALASSGDSPERYQFTWPGKRRAILASSLPPAGTLRPCRDESVDFASTGNLYIEGDNLEVLKLLREPYLGKVKMIYIDPPYNTGGDLLYNDAFAMDEKAFAAASGQRDEEDRLLFSLRANPESSGRFHTDWLNMLCPRLRLARDLLTEDGALFLSIDAHELANALKLLQEVFGEGNVLECFPRVTKKAGKSSQALARNHDYLILCARDAAALRLYPPEHTDKGFSLSDEFEAERGRYKLNQPLDYDSLQYSAALDYPIELDGETFYPGGSPERYEERRRGVHARADWAWRWSRELFAFGLKNGFVEVRRSDRRKRIYTKTYQRAAIVRRDGGFAVECVPRTRAVSSLEFVDNRYSNDHAKKDLLALFGAGVFDYTKPVALLKDLIRLSVPGEGLVLDFFSGSATTAQAVLELNAEDGGHRKFIMVQLPEPTRERSEARKAGYRTISEIGRERIRRAGARLREDRPALDAGFRALRWDSPNWKQVSYPPGSYTPELAAALADNIKEDRTAEDLLFQAMLELGLPLSSPISTEELAGKTLYTAAGGALLACFDEAVPEEVFAAAAKRKPRWFFLRDSSLPGDAAAANLQQIFETYSPGAVCRVL